MRAKTINEGIKHLAPRSEEELALHKKKLKAQIKRLLLYNDDIIEFIAEERGYDLEYFDHGNYTDITRDLLTHFKEEDLINAVYYAIQNKQ